MSPPPLPEYRQNFVTAIVNTQINLTRSSFPFLGRQIPHRTKDAYGGVVYEDVDVLELLLRAAINRFTSSGETSATVPETSPWA